MFKTLKKIRRKFFYSFVGLWIAFKEEKSFIAYFFIYAILIGVGIWLKLSSTQWAIVSMMMFLTIAVEIINTALEAAVDAISFQYNIKVKKIKDVAAAATLVMTTGLFTTVAIIYIPALIGVL